MTIFVEGAKTRLGVQKTRKDKKVTGSQDDDFVVSCRETGFFRKLFSRAVEPNEDLGFRGCVKTKTEHPKQLLWLKYHVWKLQGPGLP
jgi:hypothetical protein